MKPSPGMPRTAKSNILQLYSLCRRNERCGRTLTAVGEEHRPSNVREEDDRAGRVRAELHYAVKRDHEGRGEQEGHHPEEGHAAPHAKPCCVNLEQVVVFT